MPVGQSFALLRVPGVKGVEGFSSNQPIGRTNGSGDLLVPEILPYYGNRLSIADTDVPLDYVADIGAQLAGDPEAAPPGSLRLPGALRRRRDPQRE